jgi:tripartite-type tricarboxylate transporter receptor subunit TctC
MVRKERGGFIGFGEGAQCEFKTLDKPERRTGMKKRGDRVRGGFTRRDFLKISGLTTGGMVLGSLDHVPLTYAAAKDVFRATNITCIVPSGAGGGRDTFARAIAPFMAKYLKEVVPEGRGSGVQIRNEGGGGGAKGYTLLFNSRPDGYTIGVTETSVITDNIISDEKPEFDYPKLSFLALTLYSHKMIVAPKKGFKSWDECAAAMKSGPVKMSVSNFGNSNHVAALIMNEKAGTNFRIINFPGSADSMNAVLRENVQVGLLTENAVQGLIAAGEVNVLLELKNGATYPGAVSLKEIGHPELTGGMRNSQYLVGPPNMAEGPKNILIESIRRSLNDKEFEGVADKMKVELGKAYGKDAETLYLNFIKYYEGLTPILLKYLKK